MAVSLGRAGSSKSGECDGVHFGRICIVLEWMWIMKVMVMVAFIVAFVRIRKDCERVWLS